MADARTVVAAALIGLGTASAGWFVGDGFVEGRAAQRTVTVKGLSEREVPADLAIWPLTFTVSAGDLGSLQERLARRESVVQSFLSTRFEEGEIRSSEPEVTDRHQMGNYGGERYIAQMTVTLRTDRVDRLHEAMEETDTLVAEGVALVRSWEQRTSWMFTDLETVKPDMIAEATRDARRAAERFAHDADSHVGRIRTASQGYFSIEDRDPFSPEIKRIRVVTTITFLLED